jgi:hypothetical protein
LLLDSESYAKSIRDERIFIADQATLHGRLQRVGRIDCP